MPKMPKITKSEKRGFSPLTPNSELKTLNFLDTDER
jgi:hypothetical protein